MRCPPLSRRVATSFVAAALSLIAPNGRSSAFEVPGRTDQQFLEQQLYSAPKPTVVNYQQQVADAITIQSMKGVWSMSEKFTSPSRVDRDGLMTFRGAEFEEKGTVTYSGAAANGRGPWIIKADGFGRSPSGKVGGAIERKALWKLRRGAEGTFTYAGRINVLSYGSDGLPNAFVQGEIVQLFNGGKPKGGREETVGTFRAKLERRLTPAEEEANADSAAAGGQPEALSLITPVVPERVIQGQLYEQPR